MATAASLTVIEGYLRGVDVQPRPARRHGLDRRVALVLDTYRPDLPDAWFDAARFVDWLRACVAATGADRVQVLDDRAQLVFAADAEAAIERIAAAYPDDPPPQLVLSRREAVVGFVHVDFWLRVGGPDLYHDSYTVALFSLADVADPMVAALGSPIVRIRAAAAP